ncbi:C6 transcription factor [Colletotrichum tofieldiae]|nr:C6 transcription factor [Colletotrichum tofieldiae]
MVYKKPPPGYAEALEHAQFALVATVHKLYSMVRNQQRWDLGEPELNDGGRPMIHNIAQKLGYIRPNSDIDLPVPSVFPEDEPGLTKLARQLEKQQKERNGIKAMEAKIDSASYEESEHASSSKIDDSEFGTDYRKSVFGSHNNPKPMSPQSFSTGYTEFEIEPFASPVQQAPDVFQQNQASSMRTDQHWDMPTQTASSMYLAQNFFHHSGDNDMEIINQGVIEPEFGNIKPQVVECSSEAAMVIGDWTTYGVCDSEPM